VASSAIVLSGVSRWFGDHLAVDDVSFAVNPGEIVGFLGQNGAGKSTTMRIIAGVIGASSGRVTLGGHDVATDAIAARRLLGYLPERPPLHPEMTVREVLRFVAELHDVARAEAAVEAVMARTGLVAEADTRVAHLSKGFRQRVGLAQALVHQPKILVLDEPQSGLDPGQRRELRDLLRALAGDGVAVLLSTHVLLEAEQICDRVVLIHRGRVAAPVEADLAACEVLVRVERPTPTVEREISAIPGVFAVAPVSDGWRVRLSPAARPSVASVAVGAGLLELRATSSLEAAFLALTGGAE
jgi:ABC-2 type transport system ATP-binding protein